MGSFQDKDVEGIIIRFLILILLIMSVILIGFFEGERNAFIAPAVITFLAAAIVCSHFIYNRIMNPTPYDLMYARKQDYILAVIWCSAFFCYIEALAFIQYVFLPHAYPLVSVSPVVFQGLVLVPMAISVTYYFLWEILRISWEIPRILVASKVALCDGYRRSPGQYWGLVGFFY